MARAHQDHWGKVALLSVASSLALITGTASAQTPAAEAQSNQAQVRQIDLPAAALSKTLVELGELLGVNILADEALIAGETAPPISGSLSPTEAIERALTNTDLVARLSSSGAIIITQRIEETTERSANARPEPLTSETIVVTGSRIERTAVNSPAPIDVVTAEDIAAFGLTDTTEALRLLPALTASETLTSTNDQEAYGAATLNLRGLGTNRTLVLVNGRRHVGGIENSATVDVATIPNALIERVEVLTGGGSSIYGADAVSGVVNYLLKDDFEGIDIRANTSLPTSNGGEAFFGSITAGGNFGGGRGNAVVNFEYFNQSSLFASERGASRNASFILPNNDDVAAALGVSQDFENVLIPNLTNRLEALGPLFSLTGSTLLNSAQPNPAPFGGFPLLQTVDRNTGEVRSIPDAPFVVSFRTQGGDGPSGVFGAPAATTVPSSERFIFSTFLDYDFADGVTGFLEAKYVRSDSAGVRASSPQFFDFEVRSDNAFIPDVVQQQLSSLDAQGLDTNLNVTRSFYDDGLIRGLEIDRETIRIVTGLKGTISPALSYEVSVNYGDTKTSQVNPSTLVNDRIAAAFDAVEGPDGEIVCRSEIDAEAPLINDFFNQIPASIRSFTPGDGSCSPLNIFAPFNTLDPEGVAFAFIPTQTEFDLSQFVVNATITGTSEDFLELPGGPIRYAAGFEYRDEAAETRPDQLRLNGIINRFNRPVNIVGGDFDVIEGFAEVSLPILADLPFAKSLAVDASVRFADYSSVGSATSFAFGAVWQPIEDLRIRGSYNKAVRAPNIGELFSPQFEAQQNTGNTGTQGDPCGPTRINQGSDTRAQNCAVLIPDIDNFDDAPNAVALNVIEISGGNPDLKEERADTFTVGFAYTPSSVPGLSIVADYYDIDISGAVATVNRQRLFETCVDAPTIDNPSCAAITRNPQTGLIEQYQVTNLNLSSAVARGIDYQVSHDFNLDRVIGSDLGDFRIQIGGSYLIRRIDRLFETTPESDDRLDGELNNPKHVVNLGVGWVRGPWSADYGVNFQSSQSSTGNIGIEQIEENPFVLDRPFTGSSFVHYLGGAYQINEQMHASVRINNLFDRDPFELSSAILPRPVTFLGRTVQFGVQATF